MSVYAEVELPDDDDNVRWHEVPVEDIEGMLADEAYVRWRETE